MTLNSTIDFDYINKQFKVSAAGGSAWNYQATVVITDPRGFEATVLTVTPNDNTIQGVTRGHSTSPFISTTALGGYGILDLEPLSISFQDAVSHIRVSDNPTITGNPVYYAVAKGYETGTIPPAIRLSKIDDVYSGIPILIRRGDAVPHFYVESVASKNLLTYNSHVLTSGYLTGLNYADSLCEIISGANSGEQFYVTSHNTTTNTFTIDRDASSWTNQIFKIMPYRVCTDYSGWETYTGQSGAIRATFTIDQNRPYNIGSITTQGLYLGTASTDVGTILGTTAFGVSVTTSQAVIAEPPEMYDVLYGDTIIYLASGSLTTSYGTIVEVSAANTPVAGYRTLTYYPTGIIAPAPNGTISLYRANRFEIQTVPEFNKDFGVLVLSGTQLIDSYTVRSPSAELELSANEFDSTYASVGDVAHFHIGPVHLSNGQILPQNNILKYKVNMYQGDVTVTSPVSTWKALGTMTTDVGTTTNGSYFKLGVFTATYAQALNASETLIFDISATYGGAKLQKIITIPVQPSA